MSPMPSPLKSACLTRTESAADAVAAVNVSSPPVSAAAVAVARARRSGWCMRFLLRQSGVPDGRPRSVGRCRELARVPLGKKGSKGRG